MSTHRNPYAPSRAALGERTGPVDAEGCWREGSLLIVTHDCVLPNRCVKCNAPTELPAKERKLYWHHPGIYLVLVINVLLYLIVALIARKKIAVAPGLCTEHAKRRKLGIAIAWIGLAAGLLLVSFGGTQGPAFLVILGLVLILASVITGMLMSRVLYPKIIDERGARLKGAGEAFLSSIPSTTDWIRM